LIPYAVKPIPSLGVGNDVDAVIYALDRFSVQLFERSISLLRYGNVVPVQLQKRVAARDVEIGRDHLGAHLLDGDLRDPA
jgi:hypothetical protein